MELPLVIILFTLSLVTAATYPGLDSGRIKRLTTFGKSVVIGEQYRHDDGGRYYHDDSGKYIHQDNPYIHQDIPYIHDGHYVGDDAGKYIHQDVPYVHIEGPDGGFGPEGPGGTKGFGGYEYKKPFGPKLDFTHPNSIDYQYLPSRKETKSVDTAYLPSKKSVNTSYLPPLRG